MSLVETHGSEAVRFDRGLGLVIVHVNGFALG